LRRLGHFSVISPTTDPFQSFEFGEPIRATIRRPVFPEALPRNVSSRIRTYDFPAPTIAEVSDVRLVGRFRVGYDPQGRLIHETTIPVGYEIEKGVSLTTHLRSRFVRPSREIDVACSLVSVWHGNYGHWIFEILPRLQGVLEWQRRNGIKPKVIIGGTGDSFQRESLRLLGFEESQLVSCEEECILVRRLIVPSFRHTSRVWSPQGLRWVRDTLYHSLGIDPLAPPRDDRRILILRSGKTGRGFVNDAGVRQLLDRYGFEGHYMERLSLGDKVKLLSETSLLVGAQGAGLASIIFCKRAGLIELVGRARVYSGCFMLAQAVGCEYGYLRNPASPFTLYPLQGNIRVDLQSLDAAVHRMIDELGLSVARGGRGPTGAEPHLSVKDAA